MQRIVFLKSVLSPTTTAPYVRTRDNDCNLSVIRGPVESEVGLRPRITPVPPVGASNGPGLSCAVGRNLLHCHFSALAPDCTVKKKKTLPVHLF